LNYSKIGVDDVPRRGADIRQRSLVNPAIAGFVAEIAVPLLRADSNFYSRSMHVGNIILFSVSPNHFAPRTEYFAGLQNGSAALKNGHASLRNGLYVLQNGCVGLRNGLYALQNACVGLRNGLYVLQNGCASLRNGRYALQNACVAL